MRSRILKSSAIAMICASAVGVSGVGTAQAAAAARYRVAADEMVLPEGVTSADLQRVEEAMKVLEEMPDDIAEAGDQAVRAYLQQCYPEPAGDAQAVPQAVQPFGWWHAAMCVTAIAGALASAAVPAVKVLKLKAFIKKVGSVKQAAYLLIRVATGAEKIEHLGAVLGSLAAEVMGIAAIRNNC
ncbi:hypothetical protein [Streptomyces sp. NRRL WC-3742]|uniref:hypothetical protein n=1 Tax=Streptomyces sp. NRRL WC-3742 TaxID=1463934 RepID=UPI0004C6F4AC|nr:hypothetical protein [Streptomyces sp. NRRL WC-3742]